MCSGNPRPPQDRQCTLSHLRPPRDRWRTPGYPRPHKIDSVLRQSQASYGIGSVLRAIPDPTRSIAHSDNLRPPQDRWCAPVLQKKEALYQCFNDFVIEFCYIFWADSGTVWECYKNVRLCSYFPEFTSDPVAGLRWPGTGYQSRSWPGMAGVCQRFRG